MTDAGSASIVMGNHEFNGHCCIEPLDGRERCGPSLTWWWSWAAASVEARWHHCRRPNSRSVAQCSSATETTAAEPFRQAERIETRRSGRCLPLHCQVSLRRARLINSVSATPSPIVQ